MWVKVSYNRIFYQNGNWQDDHFLELDNGMLLAYEVAKTPSGKLARVTQHGFDHLEIKLDFVNEQNEPRTVVVLAGSIRSRNLFLHFLNQASSTQATSEASAEVVVIFETVMIKYPTEGGGSGEKPTTLQRHDSQRRNDSKRTDSLVTSKLDDLQAYMGTAQRRLFKIYSDGSLAYFEVSPVACVSVSSSSSLLCLLESPQEYATDKSLMYAVTCSSYSQDATLPQPPPASKTNPLRVLSRKLFSTPPVEEMKQYSSLPSTITFGTSLSQQTCKEWLEQIQSYSAWYHQEFARDSLDRKRAKVLLKGWCWKRGMFNLLNYHWKLRFLLVLSNKEIVYYDAELGGTVLGVISLSKMKSITKTQSADKPQGFSDIIELETLGRTWYLSPQALNRSEQAILLERWITTIRALVEEEPTQGEEEERKRNSSLIGPATGYSPTAFFNSPPSAKDLPCVPLVRASGWERISGNVPSTMLSPSVWRDDFLLRGSGAMGQSTAKVFW